MTLEREAAAELFGLSGTFPRPGWVVLDAARENRFTGELVFDVFPEVRAYLDRGEIYLVERPSDPSLGARLVDAGALNAAQLERGAMRIGGTEHLGRLFERAPSVDRLAVLVTTEMMNDSCVTWLARQNIRGVEAVPYHRHESGIHRWERAAAEDELVPGDPLPAPASTQAPVEQAPPVFEERTFSDGLIEWDEPSWLDDRSTAFSDSARAASPTAEPASSARHRPRSIDADWIDKLADEGLPEPGDDPLAVPASMPVRSAPTPDRFEIIWPSGAVDEEFGLSDTADRDAHPDQDRAGPTARIGGYDGVDPTNPVIDTGRWDLETTPPSFSAVPEVVSGDAVRSAEHERDVTDEVVLSVRRAVASIETGSLAARRRLASQTPESVPQIVPGRSATGDDAAADPTTEPTIRRPPSQSVFDEDSPTDLPPTLTAADAATADEHDIEPTRVSALRRLIGGLRRN
ncbi:MAG: hypothetical protein ABIP17_10360 [Ilumatobacteraceae bacterium]